MFQPLPIEMRKESTEQEINAEKQTVIQAFSYLRAEDIIALLNKPIKTIEERYHCQLFQALGGDLSIVNYSVNFTIDGVLNKNVELFNELNDHIFQQLSLHLADIGQGHVPKAPMFITASEFSTDQYGAAFVRHYAQRCGVTFTAPCKLKFLISTTQNPWLSQTAQGSFILTLMQVFYQASEHSRQYLIEKYGRENLLQRMQL